MGIQINPQLEGTKAAWWYEMSVAPGETVELRLRAGLRPKVIPSTQRGQPISSKVMAQREAEADEFYAAIAQRSAQPKKLPSCASVRRNDLDEAVLSLRRRCGLDGDPQNPTAAGSACAHPESRTGVTSMPTTTF